MLLMPGHNGPELELHHASTRRENAIEIDEWRIDISGTLFAMWGNMCFYACYSATGRTFCTMSALDVTAKYGSCHFHEHRPWCNTQRWARGAGSRMCLDDHCGADGKCGEMVRKTSDLSSNNTVSIHSAAHQAEGDSLSPMTFW